MVRKLVAKCFGPTRSAINDTCTIILSTGNIRLKLRWLVKSSTIPPQRVSTGQDGPSSKLTRPDTGLHQSCAGGQGLYLRSLHHLGSSSEAKDRKNPKKVKCDGRTNGRTDQRTDKAGCRVAQHATNKAGYTAAEVACGWAGAVRVSRGRI